MLRFAWRDLALDAAPWETACVDARHFDALSRVLSTGDSRRRLLAFVATFPLLDGLVAILDVGDTEGAGRRKRRKKAHKHGKGRRRKHTRKKKCTAESIALTCSGRCGSVTNNCKQLVDCGSCACAQPCDVCFTCQAGPTMPGVCVVDPAQQGESCGSDGQVCQADGSCACDASSCANPTPVCNGSTCVACSATNPCPTGQCCAGDGTCVASCPDGCCQADGVCGACLVFVTSTTSGPVFGGLDGADDICQDLASAAALPGTYLAWLSKTGGPSPATRFKPVTSPYLLVDGTTQVAENWSDLIDGSLDHAITMTESGVMVAAGSVWTGTLASGQPTSPTYNLNCDEWTTSSVSKSGAVGATNAVDSSWSYNGSLGCNVTNVRLYCFQQT